MKIVIDIDENTCHRFVNGFANENDAHLIEQLFKNGILLPKGHGRLIDADTLCCHCGISAESCSGSCEKCWDNVVYFSDIENAPTIIDADDA